MRSAARTGPFCGAAAGKPRWRNYSAAAEPGFREDGGGRFGDAGAFEEFGVLGAPQPDRAGEGEVAEIGGGDMAVLDQLVGLGQWMAHVDHVALMT